MKIIVGCPVFVNTEGSDDNGGAGDGDDGGGDDGGDDGGDGGDDEGDEGDDTDDTYDPDANFGPNSLEDDPLYRSLMDRIFSTSSPTRSTQPAPVDPDDPDGCTRSPGELTVLDSRQVLAELLGPKILTDDAGTTAIPVPRVGTFSPTAVHQATTLKGDTLEPVTTSTLLPPNKTGGIPDGPDPRAGSL